MQCTNTQYIISLYINTLAAGDIFLVQKHILGGAFFSVFGMGVRGGCGKNCSQAEIADDSYGRGLPKQDSPKA